ncbi:MAG: hypothetical protein WC788_08080 [Candidatus Paceibacterota bacterium]|jgi:hypothetical protein
MIPIKSLLRNAYNVLTGNWRSEIFGWDGNNHTEIKVDANGVVQVSGSTGGGPVQDGENTNIKASVLDYVGSNPLAVRLTDTDGNYVGAGAGTQYADGAVRGSATGTLMMGDDATNIQSIKVDADGHLQIDILNASIAVTGTFWQATQPISAASLPLPAGAATSALQGGGLPAALGAGGGLKIDGSGTALPVSGTFYQATQPVSIAATVNVDVTDEATRLLGVVYGSQGAQLQQKVTTNDLIVTLDGETVAIASIAAGDNNIGNVDIASIAAGDNNIGNVDLASAIPAGTNLVGKVSIDQVTANANEVVVKSIAAGDNNIGNVDVVTLPALASGTNAIGKLLPPDIDVTTHTNYARKYYTNAGAVTDGIIWSPAAGKRWHVVTMYIQVSAAATVTLEDDKAAGDDPVWKAELAANSGVVLQFPEKYPMASGEDAADLLITTSAANVYVTVTGYEI